MLTNDIACSNWCIIEAKRLHVNAMLEFTLDHKNIHADAGVVERLKQQAATEDSSTNMSQGEMGVGSLNRSPDCQGVSDVCHSLLLK